MTADDHDDLLVITAQRIAMLARLTPPADGQLDAWDRWTRGGHPLRFTERHLLEHAHPLEWRAATNVLRNLAELERYVRGTGGAP